MIDTKNTFILKKLTDKIIFVQIRIGKDGKPFRMYKTRTMNIKDDELYITTTDNDPRIKWWARWPRKWGIDELPQIVNILKGEMAIIGPRPMTPEELATFPREFQELRKTAMPGWFNPKYTSLTPFKREIIIETETNYILEKRLHSFLTDVKYLSIIIFNFLFRGVRSR